MIKTVKQLDIYIDESGNFDNYSEHNLIYSVAFIMVDFNDDNSKSITLFENKLSKIIGGEHFVHTGNLVRGEKPYKGMLLKDRQDLFYILFLFAKYSKYKVACSIFEKSKVSNEIFKGVADSIIETIKGLEDFISGYDSIIVHYDNGQEFLKETLLTTFEAISIKYLFQELFNKITRLCRWRIYLVTSNY